MLGLGNLNPNVELTSAYIEQASNTVPVMIRSNLIRSIKQTHLEQIFAANIQQITILIS